MTGVSGRVASCLVAACAAALAGGALWAVGDSALRQARNPAQLNFVEGFVVADALRFAGGGALYNDPREPPFSLNVYAPLYTAVLGGLAMVGAQPFVAGRLLSLAGSVAMAVVVVWAGWRRQPTVALLSASLLLLAPLQWPWSLVVRPDTWAVALSMAGVVLVARRDGAALPLGALLLFVAALFTKQTAVAGAAAVLLVVARRQPRRALQAGLTLGAIVVAIALVLQWASGGWFLFHTVEGNLNPFSLPRAVALWGAFLRAHPGEAAVLGFLLSLQAARRQLDVVGIYALLACATAATAGKAGSDLNYFLEPLAATALLAVRAWPLRWPAALARLRDVATAMVLVGALLLGATHLRDQLARRSAYAALAPVAHEVTARVRAIRGTVVSDDATLLLRADKEVFFQPFVLTQLAAAGRWDEAPLLAALEDGSVRAVIVQAAPPEVLPTRYSSAMRRVLADRYTSRWGFGLGFPYAVLEPRHQGAHNGDG